MKKRKQLSHYLDLMQSARDKGEDWNKVKRYGEMALKKLPHLSYLPFDKYLLYCRLGFAYLRLSKYSLSLDMYYTAHLIASEDHFGPEWIGYANMMVGHNLLMLYRYNQAISQFLKVEEYYQKYGDDKFPMNKELHFSTLIGLGRCYLHTGELEKAQEIIQEKLSHYQNAINDFIEYHHLKGNYLIGRKEYTQSRQSFNEFLKIGLDLNNPRLVLQAKLNLARLDIFEGQLESAIRILKALLKDARQLKFNAFICRIVLVLSKCYLLKNMPAKSASLEKMITPLLKSLDITWFYETTRDLEKLYRQLQPIYQNLASPLIPEIITNKIDEYYQSSPYAKAIIGKSNAMREVLQLVEKIAPTNLPVLIQGETGTGKELVAHAIHNNSLRKEKLWLALNCGALQETLLENELFGHTKGAFTDAKEEKKGYIEIASDGTLFLDEIGDMSPVMQQKLLRVLEEKLVWRLGAQKPVPINTRFIFASNQNIEVLVRQTSTGSVQGKRFREDLYYRINTIVITLPPLRERKEDIPLLINHFLEKYYPKIRDEKEKIKDEIVRQRGLPSMTPEVLDLLINYPWPGNVRELENELARIYALYPNNKIITELMLSDNIRNYALNISYKPKEFLKLKELKDIYERNLIVETLKKYNGNIKQTAHQLGCPRSYLYRKMNQLKLLSNTAITKR